MLNNGCTKLREHMAITKTYKDRLHTVIPLSIKPDQDSVVSITGSANSKQAGTVLYGFYSMDYLLPGNDKLRLIANHNKSHVQIILLTEDPQVIRELPGKRPSSLVANTISQINRYLIRSDSYDLPKTDAQIAKYIIAQTCIQSLSKLLKEERKLSATDWVGQEMLRQKVINLIEECRDKNRLLANNPIISEGALGDLLYDTKQMVQQFVFNRVFPVSRIDQLDFSKKSPPNLDTPPCFIWDSEIHTQHDHKALEDTLRIICKHYQLEPAEELSHLPANRFQRLSQFFNRLWLDGQDWVSYLSLSEKPKHKQEITTRSDGLSITKIEPYHHLEGFTQKGYESLEALIHAFAETSHAGEESDSKIDATTALSYKANGHWTKIKDESFVLIRLQDGITRLHFTEENGLFYPLPSGQDLMTLSQLSKRHLYLPERTALKIKAFFSRAPGFFVHLYRSLYTFISHDLHDEFINHIHANHPSRSEEVIEEPHLPPEEPEYLRSIHKILIGEGLLSDGQTLQSFVKTHIKQHNYVVAREEHPESPPDYTNPFHRTFNILRHFAGFFINTSEKNPIIGTLAMAAYAYGAGAVIAPQTLTALLTKLHLKGLIYGIEPTQALGRWMSHGNTSEAISAACTYWQATIVGGDLDGFFIQAIKALHEDPAEIAIIVALALSLGYGLCEAVPALGEEMGEFPYANYLALGAKSGAALYDLIMHPGDDWFLGTIKWLLRGGVIFGKLLVAPFIEWAYYGYKEGFVSGLRKSLSVLLRTSKQIIAATLDLFLALNTIPFLEVSALFIHVPFRGITNLLSKTLGILGQWRPIAEALLQFANRPGSYNYMPGFRPSPLYGFDNPISPYSTNMVLNILANIGMIIVLPPFQLIKNILILPIIDIASFFVRVTLSIADPLARLTAYTLGYPLVLVSNIWDVSLGLLFQGMANCVTLGSNWVDKSAGTIRQDILSGYQVLRRMLYHWAFREEDARMHKVNDDEHYFKEKPIRLEQIPHDTTRSLLQALVNPVRKPMGRKPLIEEATSSIVQRGISNPKAPIQLTRIPRCTRDDEQEPIEILSNNYG